MSFFDDAVSTSATVFGVPEEFSLDKSLIAATAIRLASAFGHMSGWNKIEAALLKSKADQIEILLGPAFFQTEPSLLMLLKKLSESQPRFKVRLAPFKPIFHSKVWIIIGLSKQEAIVGSSNLSGGGLTKNVECNLYTSVAEDVENIDQWFDDQ